RQAAPPVPTRRPSDLSSTEGVTIFATDLHGLARRTNRAESARRVIEQAMTPASESPLFQPLRLGAWEMRNRIVLAPLTRCRASADRKSTRLNSSHVKF